LSERQVSSFLKNFSFPSFLEIGIKKNFGTSSLIHNYHQTYILLFSRTSSSYLNSVSYPYFSLYIVFFPIFLKEKISLFREKLLFFSYPSYS
jgi:hypothetical protein